jgi:type II secretion system protein N
MLQNLTHYLKVIFLYNKMKIVFFLISSFVFCILFFPLTELGEKIVAETNSSGLVYLEFETMELSFFPLPSVIMQQAVVDSPMIEQVEIKELRVSPSILALMQFAFTRKLKPHVSIDAEGLFGGTLEADTSSSSKIKDDQAVQLNLSYSDFDLKVLAKSLGPQFPVAPSGQGQIEAKIDLDPSMKSQPDGAFELNLAKLMIPQFELATAFGPMALPTISFQKVVLKGILKNGKLTLKDTQLGSGSDELILKISGEIDLRVFPGGTPQVGFYNLAVDLNLKKSMLTKLGPVADSIQPFLGKFSTTTSDGQRYAFRIQANGFSDPMPQFSAL